MLIWPVVYVRETYTGNNRPARTRCSPQMRKLRFGLAQDL